MEHFKNYDDEYDMCNDCGDDDNDNDDLQYEYVEKTPIK